MKRRKPLTDFLILIFGMLFSIGLTAYTIQRAGGIPALSITIGDELTDVNKASMDSSPFEPLALSDQKPPKQPVIQPVKYHYEPSYNDIVVYIRKINAEVVRQKVGPVLTEAQVKKIVTSTEKHCVTYGVNKFTIFAMMSVESSMIIRIPSYLGAKYGRGLLQVSEIALEDFNSWTGKSYTIEDLYTIDKNIEVGVWAFNQNYYYGVEQDFEHGAIIAYNVGVSDYKKHKKDLLSQKFKGYDYNYLIKVQTEYDTLMRK